MPQDAEVITCPGGSSDEIGRAILARAQELGAGLLALAPHTKTAAQRVLQGSVTEACLR